MKAEELRLGNLVQRPENLRIKQLDGEHIYFGIDFNMMRDCILYGDDWAFEPIPLSEEWLVKFGFEYFMSNKSFQLDTNIGFSFWGRVETGIYVYVESDEIGEPYFYVHSLQNAFYALTGEELKIKE